MRNGCFEASMWLNSWILKRYTFSILSRAFGSAFRCGDIGFISLNMLTNQIQVFGWDIEILKSASALWSHSDSNCTAHFLLVCISNISVRSLYPSLCFTIKNHPACINNEMKVCYQPVIIFWTRLGTNEWHHCVHIQILKQKHFSGFPFRVILFFSNGSLNVKTLWHHFKPQQTNPIVEVVWGFWKVRSIRNVALGKIVLFVSFHPFQTFTDDSMKLSVLTVWMSVVRGEKKKKNITHMKHK